MPHYAYIWVRHGTHKGLMHIVPGHRLEQALQTLRILQARDPRYRWHVVDELETAVANVAYAIRTGGGKWAGPCGSLFCATGEHEVCFRANVDASKWLWGEVNRQESLEV